MKAKIYPLASWLYPSSHRFMERSYKRCAIAFMVSSVELMHCNGLELGTRVLLQRVARGDRFGKGGGVLSKKAVSSYQGKTIQLASLV
jgi:hypothetical protein